MLRIHELTVQYSCTPTPKWLHRLRSLWPAARDRDERKAGLRPNPVILDHLNLELARGEFLAILGVSGAGKTTLLRAVAGLLRPKSGDIFIDGQQQIHRPPHLRDVAYVFQSGGWYDHLTVRQHFQLGKAPPRITDATPSAGGVDWLDRVGLGGLEDQRPGQLSGGQLQRLAIGRALAREKSLLLLDEPLSQLDEPSCEELRRLLQTIHSEGNTIVYVTHSQRDAFMLATKVAVLHEGVLRQMASPHVLYDRPNHISVAKSMGFPAMEFLTAKDFLDNMAVRQEVSLGWEWLSPEDIVGVRPKDWKLIPIESSCGIAFNGRWAGKTFVDGAWLGRVAFKKRIISVWGDAATKWEQLKIGDAVELRVDPQDFHYFDPTTGNRIQVS
jgi:ABC-type sugar transport system ATPase subunit